MEWFRNRVDVKIVIETWRRHYNEVRPHSSLGQLTLAEFKQSEWQRHTAAMPTSAASKFQRRRLYNYCGQLLVQASSRGERGGAAC
jgi:Integrase core domain